jgi:hypothetical protein
MKPDFELLILAAWLCQQDSIIKGEWEDAAYQDGRIDAYQQVQRLLEEKRNQNGL